MKETKSKLMSVDSVLAGERFIQEANKLVAAISQDHGKEVNFDP